LPNGHLQTIYPALFRKVRNVEYQRERISTPDNDFLDLDWSCVNADQLVIVSHGMEGDSQRPYVKGMVLAFNKMGYDALAWNFRGCSGEINKTIRFYHSGATDDLDLVIQHAIRKRKYASIILVGFSLGGNLTLKYLGEQGVNLPGSVKKVITFSVPLDLYGSSLQIEKPVNYVYKMRFLRSLKNKVRTKAAMMPGMLDTKGMDTIRSIFAFDDHYTALLHGFTGAPDYYQKCSAIHFLKDIRIPTLIVNARNDSFLSKTCYPDKNLLQNKHLFFETPLHGGHCGFKPRVPYPYDCYWSEHRALEFVKNAYEFSLPL
jgi:hypothetical protein